VTIGDETPTGLSPSEELLALEDEDEAGVEAAMVIRKLGSEALP
jgi:hypothetical protein